MPPARSSSSRRSAGLMLYRRAGSGLEVLLVHPGGPFFQRRDEGVWSVPKGEYLADEDPLAAARREFGEETGTPAPDGDTVALGEVRQRSGKRVVAWAIEGDLDPATIVSNTCLVEWPPRSGRRLEIPEVDRAGWFAVAEARAKLIPAQVELLERLLAQVG